MRNGDAKIPPTPPPRSSLGTSTPDAREIGPRAGESPVPDPSLEARASYDRSRPAEGRIPQIGYNFQENFDPPQDDPRRTPGGIAGKAAIDFPEILGNRGQSIHRRPKVAHSVDSRCYHGQSIHRHPKVAHLVDSRC